MRFIHSQEELKIPEGGMSSQITSHPSKERRDQRKEIGNMGVERGETPMTHNADCQCSHQ